MFHPFKMERFNKKNYGVLITRGDIVALKGLFDSSVMMILNLWFTGKEWDPYIKVHCKAMGY